MAGNPIHNVPLFEVIGHGTQDSADKWDGIIRRVYDAHGITSQRQLSQATGVPTTTLQSCGAFKEPHRMTYRAFLKICDGLDVDKSELINEFHGYDPAGVEAFDAVYEEVKARAYELVSKFLELDEATQQTVLTMVSALEGDGSESIHSEACELLSEQLDDVFPRCKSWDYIDLS